MAQDSKPLILLGDINDTEEEYFWWFVNERQSIWHRRFIEKIPAPWTDDSLLRKYSFTNAYRSLDRGTKWIINACDGGPFREEKIWRTVIYRAVNRPETFEECGWPPVVGPMDDWYAKICARRERGEPILKNVYLTLAGSLAGERKEDTIKRFVLGLQVRFEALRSDLWASADAKSAHAALMRIPMIGPFIAAEIVLDFLLMGNVLRCECDDGGWVFAGPGVKWAVIHLFPKSPQTQAAQIEAIHWLAANQRNRLKKYGFNDFKFLDGKPMSIGDIEHSLCEWRKHFEARAGDISLRKRMLFIPITKV